jgi:hypothetical protein
MSTSTSLLKPQAILDFWFGEPALFNDLATIKNTMGRWYMNTDPLVDVAFKEAVGQIELLGGEDEMLGAEWFTPKGNT